MRLPLFYPLAYALVAVMVFYAIKPGLERMQEWRRTLDVIADTGLAIDGDALRGLIVNERAAIVEVGANPLEHVIVSSVGVFDAENISGAHYFISPEAVDRLRGLEIDVMFDVRSPSEGGASEWVSRAAVEGVLDTGWTPQQAQTEWTRAALRLAIPDVDIRMPLHLMIWSDAAGNNGDIELRRIELLPAEPGLASPAARLDPVETG